MRNPRLVTDCATAIGSGATATNIHTVSPNPVGRPRRGKRVEFKLPDDLASAVEALVGVEGADRSEVLAVLVRRGLHQ